MSKVTKALKADLPALAELLRSKGKGKDTILAHINPREAALLKRHGGSGEINPDTGLPMFATEDDFNVPPPAESYGPSIQDASPDVQQSYTGAQTGGVPTAVQDVSSQPIPTVNQTNVPQQNLTTGMAQGGEGLYTSPTGGVTGQPGGSSVPLTLPQAPETYGGQLTAAQPSITDRAGAALGNVTTQQLVKALGLGGLGLLGARNANVAGAQNQAATAQQQAIAQPYQAQGQEMIGAAQRGELTPQSQQAYQAAMAQANQSLANRGGVGQAQVQQQMANLYNQLLQNQYTYGLQVAQIGDNIAIGAIKQGLTLDQNLQTTTQNFYAQLAAIASGSVIGGTRQGVTP